MDACRTRELLPRKEREAFTRHAQILRREKLPPQDDNLLGRATTVLHLGYVSEFPLASAAEAVEVGCCFEMAKAMPFSESSRAQQIWMRAKRVNHCLAKNARHSRGTLRSFGGKSARLRMTVHLGWARRPFFISFLPKSLRSFAPLAGSETRPYTNLAAAAGAAATAAAVAASVAGHD
jgi:hypothetical protein